MILYYFFHTIRWTWVTALILIWIFLLLIQYFPFVPISNAFYVKFKLFIIELSTWIHFWKLIKMGWFFKFLKHQKLLLYRWQQNAILTNVIQFSNCLIISERLLLHKILNIFPSIETYYWFGCFLYLINFYWIIYFIFT